MVNHSQGGINAGMITNTNVSYTKPTANQVLKYDATLDQWVPGTDASSTDATQLQGVDICTTTPTDQQVLTYDLATTEWCPSTPAGGGGKVLQVVTLLNNFQYNMPNSWNTSGQYISITPTSATNKLLLFSAPPTRGGDQYAEFALDYYRYSAGQVSGQSPLGTSMFADAWPGGILMDSHFPALDYSYLNAMIPMNLADDGYGTTDEVFYNLAVKVSSNSYPAEIPSQMWTSILMEIDES